MSSSDPICQRCGRLYLSKNKTNMCPKCLEERFLDRGSEIKELQSRTKQAEADCAGLIRSIQGLIAKSNRYIKKGYNGPELSGYFIPVESMVNLQKSLKTGAGSAMLAELEKKTGIVKGYATAARVIGLFLKEFCDESLPYDEMIAESSRRAAKELEITRQALELAAEELYRYYELTDSDEVYMENCGPTIGDVYRAIVKGFILQARERGQK